MINAEIRMTLFMRGPRLVMQIEFMAKSYGALAVVDVTLLSSRLARSATAARNRANEAECGCEGEKEQRTDRWLRYEHALK